MGTIRSAGTPGRLEGRDAAGRFRGTYDAKTNETRDGSGRLVAKGNILSALIAGAAAGCPDD